MLQIYKRKEKVIALKHLKKEAKENALAKLKLAINK